MKKITGIIIGFSVVFGAASAFATPITGVTASTDMGIFGTGVIPQNTVDGSGLDVVSFAGIHSGTSPSNSWASLPGTTTGLVTFNLNDLYLVNSFAFWNQNNGGPGADGITGINRINVLTSMDGTNFFPLAGGPTSFLQETGDTSSAQIFNFTPTWAKHMQFSILSNHGDQGASGFGEVLFDGTPIPEPATMLLLATGLVGVAGAARRKKKK